MAIACAAGREITLFNVKPTVGFTLPWAGVTPAPSVKRKVARGALLCGGRETGYDLPMATRETLALIDRLMLEMIAQQEGKVLAMARAIHPGLTTEDIRNPNDFADLMASGEWNFEDGILSGLKSAHMAIRAKLLESIE